MSPEEIEDRINGIKPVYNSFYWAMPSMPFEAHSSLLSFALFVQQQIIDTLENTPGFIAPKIIHAQRDELFVFSCSNKQDYLVSIKPHDKRVYLIYVGLANEKKMYNCQSIWILLSSLTEWQPSISYYSFEIR